MPKRRKIQVDAELLKELEELELRMRKTDREIEKAIAEAEEVRKRLRERYLRS